MISLPKDDPSEDVSEVFGGTRVDIFSNEFWPRLPNSITSPFPSSPELESS